MKKKKITVKSSIDISALAINRHRGIFIVLKANHSYILFSGNVTEVKWSNGWDVETAPASQPLSLTKCSKKTWPLFSSSLFNISLQWTLYSHLVFTPKIHRYVFRSSIRQTTTTF